MLSSQPSKIVRENCIECLFTPSSGAGLFFALPLLETVKVYLRELNGKNFRDIVVWWIMKS